MKTEKFMKTTLEIVGFPFTLANMYVNTKLNKNYKVSNLYSSGLLYPSVPWIRNLLNQFT
ncbi:hypothetical protein H4683_004112 [Filibacter limicola]|uniref:Uncharacterized protein n=1 Tax=Sporosarcina limicola TaxID=34101 RepID=A0A927MN04_9BACL|nr:hypothetical protein [Sporosarcina limicola]